MVKEATTTLSTWKICLWRIRVIWLLFVWAGCGGVRTQGVEQQQQKGIIPQNRSMPVCRHQFSLLVNLYSAEGMSPS